MTKSTSVTANTWIILEICLPSHMTSGSVQGLPRGTEQQCGP